MPTRVMARERRKGKLEVKEQEVDDERHEDEDIDCVSVNKILKKYDDEDGNRPEGNGSGVFDAIPSGIDTGGDIFTAPEQSFGILSLLIPPILEPRYPFQLDTVGLSKL
jgi:hypothetical protein